ncbi:MAG: MMPL family transporter [Clostridiales bacterium]|jgi:predicted RND superfamily exporter protein|nr:MMPL family transporter [Clostridiales bacterium]
MAKICKFIVKFWYIFTGLFAVLLGVSIYLIPKVEIVYNFTHFLPEDSETYVALEITADEFGTFTTAQIMLTGESAKDAQKLADQINASGLPGLTGALFSNDAEHVKSDTPYGPAALVNVMFQGDSSSANVANGVAALRDMLDGYENQLAGPAVTDGYLRQTVADEMLIMLAVAVPVIMLILFLTSRSFIEPLVFLIVLGFAAAINMGTNYFLGGISYVTHSIAVILQLALAMDYAIIFLHRYREERIAHDCREAVALALQKSVLSISASCLTTVAGLVAIMFMRLQIGYDIGIVLTKGIVTSLLSVFLFMPGMIVLFNRALEKTAHRPWLPKMEFIPRASLKIRRAVPVAALALIALAFILQLNTPIGFVDALQTHEPQIKINGAFGSSSQVCVLVPKGDRGKELELTGALLKLKGISGPSGLMSELSKIKLNENLPYTAADQFNAVEFGALLYGLGADPIEAAVLSPAVFQAYCDAHGISYRQGLFGGDAFTLRLYFPDLIMTLLSDEIAAARPGSAFLQALRSEGSPYAPLFAELQRGISTFESERYARIIFSVSVSGESAEGDALIAAMRAETKKLYPDEYYLLGDAVFVNDIKTTFNSDQTMIAVLTALFILIILAGAFRSASIPVLLTLTIQGAVWLNFAVSAVTGGKVVFLGYIIVSSIQMGATIDYAIVITGRYREMRKALKPREAAKGAVTAEIPTVLTSGGIMILAGYIIGWISQVPSIGGLGSLLGRGALFSVAFVLFILPALLVVFDKLIDKTTMKRPLWGGGKKAAAGVSGGAGSGVSAGEVLPEVLSAAVAVADNGAGEVLSATAAVAGEVRSTDGAAAAAEPVQVPQSDFVQPPQKENAE